MQQAILYTRFSSLEQRDGVSLERQLERCNELALEMGLNVERIVSDSGKSAFKAEHRLSGAGMAQIEQDAKNGLLIGKVLLIEKISRLSREDPHDSYDLVRSLTKNGVTVACWDKRMVLKAYENLELVGLIQYFVMAQTVYEESVAKQDFSRDKWARRRVEMQSGKIVTSLCPAWLKPSPDRSNWEVIGEGADRDGVMRHDRGAIVKFILAQADEGLGSYQIASRLNEQRVPPWPRFQGENRNPPKDWSHKRVHRIMTDIAVIGDCQPMQRDDKGNSVPACDPIRNYYPRLVAPDVFQRVQETAGARREVKGRRSAVVANLVSGLAVCEYCGGKMIYHRGRTTGSVPTRHGVADAMVKVDTGSLVCGNASRRIDEDDPDFCDNKRWVAYLGLERALLDSCLHLAMDDSAFAQTNVIAELNVKIADLRRDAEIATGKAEKLINTFATSDGAAADIALKAANAAAEEAKRLNAEIEELETQRRKAGGEATAAEQLSRIATIRADLYADDLEVRKVVRSKVATALRGVIDKIVCTNEGASVVIFKGDTRRVFIAPGRGRRASSFEALDFMKPGQRSDDPIVQRFLDRHAATRQASDTGRP